MQRNLAQLAGKTYDLLVVGAGVYGACIAWDAAQRGFSVALIDKKDFGHATSANSLKTIHGGLRYLQDANIPLVRTMIQERRAMLRIAPHLVHPLPCVMPTYKKLMKSRLAMTAALFANDLLGFDRNRVPDPQKHLPRSKVVSRDDCLGLLPGIADKSLTGGAVWYDAQMYNSERMTLAFVLSAVQAGAEAANYVEAVNFLKNERAVTGVKAKDVLTGEEFEILAKVTVNTVGPWTDEMLRSLNTGRQTPKFYPSIAVNVVTRQIIPQYAVGLPSKYEFKNGRAITSEKSRILFVAPWRDYSILGTVHIPCNGRREYTATEQEVQDFIDEVNAAYPDAALNKEDVRFVHSGLLPALQHSQMNKKVKLVREGQVYDHQQRDNIEGLVTVVGVKYTTARRLAQQAVDLISSKFNQKAAPCRTHITPVAGGEIDRFDEFLAAEMNKHPKGLSKEVVKTLIYNYGSAYPEVLKYINEDPEWGKPISSTSQVIKAEVLHAVCEEMAQTLADVVFRRTELGSAGKPDDQALETCAKIMAARLGWTRPRIEAELNETKAVFPQYN